jgi:hypothetical protein
MIIVVILLGILCLIVQLIGCVAMAECYKFKSKEDAIIHFGLAIIPFSIVIYALWLIIFKFISDKEQNPNE